MKSFALLRCLLIYNIVFARFKNQRWLTMTGNANFYPGFRISENLAVRDISLYFGTFL